MLGPPRSSSAARGGAGVFDNIVQRASNPDEDAASLPPVDAEGNSRRITMYRNGFTVDDGPLRDLSSPESRAFIASLENGDVPQGKLYVLLGFLWPPSVSHFLAKAFILHILYRLS